MSDISDMTAETPEEAERHATNLELFLDLVFVFAITQIASLSYHPTASNRHDRRFHSRQPPGHHLGVRRAFFIVGGLRGAPLVCGLVLYAVVVKHLIPHPEGHLTVEDRWLLALIAFILGVMQSITWRRFRVGGLAYLATN